MADSPRVKKKKKEDLQVKRSFAEHNSDSCCMTSLVEQPANDDMQQNVLFADSLKDLKNLRTQLYSAAEYFELSYTNDNQKQLVLETIKEYAIKAFVNTVDHLGHVTYKVDNLLNEKVKEVSGTELKASCLEQRLRMCKEYIDQEGLAQQSSIIETPKHHKRYVLPVGETIKCSNNLANLKIHGFKLEDVDDWHQFKHAFRESNGDAAPTSSFRKGRSVSPSLKPSMLLETFSFTDATRKKDPVRRSESPHRFPLLRSGSLATRPTMAPKPSSPAKERPQWNPSKQFRSASMQVVVHGNRENDKEMQLHSSKSKGLLKSLLSRRKLKKDDTLNTYLDEY
ncbi:hypothetical protein V2J09_002107 [Rumex salicifolius]